MMKTTLEARDLEALAAGLGRGDAEVPAARAQPLHTFYGGAHLFRADLAGRLGALALRSLQEHAPEPAALAAALELPGDAALWAKVHGRVQDKLRRAPIEDLRIDFEDGYGPRGDAEEDGHAVAAAQALAAGLGAGTLPPSLGLRIKPLSGALWRRAARTLDLFLTTLAGAGARAAGLLVTLPKVEAPGQVAALAGLLATLEARLGWPAGGLRVELMIETPRAVLAEGRLAAPALVAAAGGRCAALHLGAYDYLSALGVGAAEQSLEHPACGLARGLLLTGLWGQDVALVDGATNELPIPPHRAVDDGPLGAAQREENQRVVVAAWRRHARSVRRGLAEGYFQGWDLHPAQLVARYGVVYGHFLAGLPAVCQRLTRFLDQAARASRVGAVFDDAATAEGLLNHLRRGLLCGALLGEDLAPFGLTEAELALGTFPRMLAARVS